ncbi:MAG: cofactor-independent phosphoglycerate mutase [Proteobacteria bacterium]|nr:cofactor-independent phosphoglycerate mutase [Pseudomonadota bacterium]
MKSIIILGDGMSDHPVAALNGRTPLMVAKKPAIDYIARQGRSGLLHTIPDGMPMGSEVANLSVLGYDPTECFQGRGVLEAASMGVLLDANDVGMRCNLICVDDDGRIRNHSAGHISTDEAHVLIEDLQKALGGQGPEPVAFHPGVSYRHLLVFKGFGHPQVHCAPPHDHVGELERDLLPRALHPEAESTARRLRELMTAARDILASHPINLARVAAGKDPANRIWPWSLGRRPSMATFQEMYGISGAVISAVDLIQGIGVLGGMEKIEVPGATGLFDTNYEGKAAAALEAIQRHDFVYVHVEAADEAGHERDLELKIRCIEDLDQRLVRLILAGIEKMKTPVILSVLPDHPTPVETGLHNNDPVPVAIWHPGKTPDAVAGYDEEQVKQGALGTMQKDAFFRRAIGR